MSRFGFANRNHAFLQIPDDVMGVYNLHDTYWTARLVAPLMKDLRDHHQEEFYTRYSVPMQSAIVDMQRRGLLLDKEALKVYRAKILKELRACDNRIRDRANKEEFTYTDKFPNSRDQVVKFLFGPLGEGGLGLKSHKTTAKGKRPSADQDALMRVLRNLRKKDEHARLVLYDLFHRTRIETIRARYLNLTPDPDGRVRPVVKLAHVKTLRLAYEDPALQQWPDEARHLFVAKPGHLLLSVDYAQLEARLLAYFSQDPGMIEAFERGEDVHAKNARDLFNLTIEEWNELVDQEPFRVYAKSGFLYVMVYGGTASNEVKKLFCPCPQCAAHSPPTITLLPGEAAEAERRWMALHPRVLEYQEEVAQFVKRHGYYEPLLGGRRYVTKPWGKDLARELKNIPNQTGGAHLMYRAQANLYQQGAPIVLQHHDSFVLEVPEDKVDEWYTTTQAAMEEPVTIGGCEVSFPVDAKVGRNWGRRSDANPHGLVSL